MKIVKRFLLLSILVAATWAGFIVLRMQYGLSAAEDSVERGAWKDARVQLRRYLWLHPRDGQAHLKMAESLVKDERLPTNEAVAEAIDHLKQIPDESPLGAEARVQQARLRFLILHHPIQAERLFHHAIQLDPHSFEAHYLLWKLLDMTGRSHLAEPVFWKVYQLTPPSERAFRLREWYMSQFFPATANPTLDRMMGFADGSEPPTANIEFLRLQHFRANEPNAPIMHATLARWFYREGDPKHAMTLLREAFSLDTAFEETYFLATLVAVSIELGDFEDAERFFARWPQPHSGYEYWRWKGMIDDEIRHDYQTAIEAYDKALGVWPGQANWEMQFRKAQCLVRLGNNQQAKQVRQAAKTIELLMESDVHERLRKALAHLEDSEQIKHLVEFYRALGRQREVECWMKQIELLRSKSTQSH